MAMRRFGFLLVGLLLVASPALAQNTAVRTAVDLDAATDCALLDVGGMGTGAVQVVGTYTGTITWTVSVDGANFVAIDLFTPDAPATAVNSTTSTGIWTGPVAGLRTLKACMTAYTSGTAYVTLRAVGTGGGGGGGGSATASLTNQEADDASIATGTTHDSVAALTMAFDGTVWRRLTFGTAGTASAQVLTVQGVASMTPLLVTLSGTNNLTGNQAVNVAQIDGAAVPASACDDPAKVTSITISDNTLGDSEIVALTAGQVIYVCGWGLFVDGANDARFVYGTGADCATGQTGLTGVFPLDTTNGTAMVVSNGGAVNLKAASANAVCLELSANVAVTGWLAYVKQ